jgi:hypothetical protein
MDSGFCEMAELALDAVVTTNHVINSMTAWGEYGQKRTSIQVCEPIVSGQLWTTATFQCIAIMASNPENMFQDTQCIGTWKTTQRNTIYYAG